MDHCCIKHLTRRVLDWQRTTAQGTPCPLPRDDNMDGDAPLHDEQPTNNPMTVSFRDANGAAVDFKMKPSTKLGKAMAAFSNKIGRDPMQLRFLFDGERVAEEDTPTTVSLVSDW